METGHELQTLTGNNVALSADGRLAVSDSDDKTLKIWDVETGHELCELIHANPVKKFIISANGSLVFSVSSKIEVIRQGYEEAMEIETVVNVWEVTTGSVLRSYFESDFVGSLAVSADTELFIYTSGNSMKLCALSDNSNIRDRLNDSVSGKKLEEKLGLDSLDEYIPSLLPVGEIYANASSPKVAISADRKLLVSTAGNILIVWDATTGLEIRRLQRHNQNVSCVALSADGQVAVSGSFDNTLKVWDTSVEYNVISINGVVLSADGRLAISSSSDNTLKIQDATTGHELGILKGGKEIAMSADGKIVISAVNENILKVWNIETGREIHTLVGHISPITYIDLSADGRLAVSVSSDKTLKVWDVLTGHLLRTFDVHRFNYAGGFGLVSAALSADGKLAVTSIHGYINIWSIDERRKIVDLCCNAVGAAVTLSADGRLVVYGSFNRLVVILASTGLKLCELMGHIDG